MKEKQSPLLGRWRIIEADLWGRDYLDLVEPALLTVGSDGRGEIAFGAMQASLNIAYGLDNIDFTWRGSDEGDEVQGSGYAELLDDGSIQIEFEYQESNEAVLKAVRETTSPAC